MGWADLAAGGDGQVFVGDIPDYVTPQDIYKMSEDWNRQWGTDIPLQVDFNNKRSRLQSTVGKIHGRPNSATLTFL